MDDINGLIQFGALGLLGFTLMMLRELIVKLPYFRNGEHKSAEALESIANFEDYRLQFSLSAKPPLLHLNQLAFIFSLW